MPEDVSKAILTSVEAHSLALQSFTHVKMSRKQTRLPVLSSLPVAYFVNGDTGLKQATNMAWANKFLNAEVLAVILPIPDEVADDADYDIVAESTSAIATAIARKIDAAVLFGTDKPVTWGDAIVPEAILRNHVVVRGRNAVAAGGLAQDLSDLFALVEEDGYDSDLLAFTTRYKGLLRGARDSLGRELSEVSPTNVYGTTPIYPARGLWPVGLSVAEGVVGDSTQALLGIRTDMQYKVLTEGVISDDTGKVILNLAQQDAKALRITFRCAFEVANTIRFDNENAATRYPFAVITSPAV